MNIPEYYLNNGNNHSCIKLPSKNSGCLLKENYLKEYESEVDREKVFFNLGLDSKFLELKRLIDNKTISQGSIPFDNTPTSNSHNLLDSDAIYKALSNYYTKDVIETKILYIFDTLGQSNDSENNVSIGDHQQCIKAAILRYNKDNSIHSSQFEGESYTIDNSTNLGEIYSGDNFEISSFDIYTLILLKPNDVLRIRGFYRRGFSYDGINQFKNDSDAYVYLSDDLNGSQEKEHLFSECIKLKSLGSFDLNFTEALENFQDLILARDIFNSGDYGYHYLLYNGDIEKLLYLHIKGIFPFAGSWLVLDGVDIFRSREDVSSDNFLETLTIELFNELFN